MTQARVGGGRRYSGLDARERTAQRRAAILVAAVELFGTKGYAATSVKQICVEAELSERYFYESFTDRHYALVTVYVDIIDEVRGATLAAIESAGTTRDTLAERALAAFVETLTRDPRRARIVLIEVVGVSPMLETRRHGVLREFAELVATLWLTPSDRDTPTEAQWLTSVALVGAVNHLLVDWLLGGQQQKPSVLVDVCAALFAAARDKQHDPSSDHNAQ